MTGCQNTTIDCRPLCTEHALQSTYARQVLEEIARREQEYALVLVQGWVAVDLEASTRVQEILALLEHYHELSLERLRQLLFLDVPPGSEGIDEAFRGYVEALVNAGIIVVETKWNKKRGHIMTRVRLTRGDER